MPVHAPGHSMAAADHLVGLCAAQSRKDLIAQALARKEVAAEVPVGDGIACGLPQAQEQ